MKPTYSTTTLLFPICLCAVLLLSGCGNRSGKQPVTQDSVPQAQGGTRTQLPGSDRDPHGCIGSAGYQWSEVQQKCIRIFEAGTQLTSTTDPDATTAAYLVFGADSLSAELFLPGSKNSFILHRTSTPQSGYIWRQEQGGALTAQYTGNLLNVEQQGKPIYRQKAR